MDKKFLGWMAFAPNFPIYMLLEQLAEFQNELSAEGYVTYMTYVAAGERVSSDVGMVFSSEPITEEEANEAFEEFLKQDEEEDS